jgi:hypothetical protein
MSQPRIPSSLPCRNPSYRGKHIWRDCNPRRRREWRHRQRQSPKRLKPLYPGKWFASDDRWQVGPHTRQLTRVKKLELVGPLLRKSLSPERTSGIIQVSPVPVHTSGQLGGTRSRHLAINVSKICHRRRMPRAIDFGTGGIETGGKN